MKMGIINIDNEIEILDMDEDGERLWSSCSKDDEVPNVGYIDDLIVVIGSDEATVRKIAKNAIIAELELR
jgi:hypothetical protein